MSQDRLEERLTRMMEAVERAERRERRQEVRLQGRAERRGNRRRGKSKKAPATDIGQGAVFLAIASVLLYLGLTGGPFWFLFVALGLGISGVTQLTEGLSNRNELAATNAAAPAVVDAPPVVSTPRDPEADRVDDTAAKLLQELKTGPAILREIVRKPAETVEGLRRGYHALADRERALRAASSAEEGARLETERKSLQDRIARESDAVTRTRYEEALAALAVQERERAEMNVAANRLEAERLKLRMTLEGLLAQVVRARAMHGSPGESEAQLRATLERMSDEIGAVTEALESVDEPGHRMEPIAPIASSDDVSLPAHDKDRVR